MYKSVRTVQRQPSWRPLGGCSPLPISNRAVKPRTADGTEFILGRVSRCQDFITKAFKSNLRGFFCLLRPTNDLHGVHWVGRGVAHDRAAKSSPRLRVCVPISNRAVKSRTASPGTPSPHRDYASCDDTDVTHTGSSSGESHSMAE